MVQKSQTTIQKGCVIPVVNHTKWAPSSYKWSVTTPINGLINGFAWGYFTLLTGLTIQFITGMGPPCGGYSLLVDFFSSIKPVLSAESGVKISVPIRLRYSVLALVR